MSINLYSNELLHNEITDDILQTIPDYILPALRDIFKHNWPYSVQSYTFIDQLIKWKHKKPNTRVRFTSPYGKWQDGTFVAIITEYTYNVFFFSLNKTCKKLIRALRETKLIDWTKGPYICAIHDDHDKYIMRTLPVLGEIQFDIESTCFWLPKEISKNYEIICPEEVYLAPLKPDHIPFINSLWTHSFAGSEAYLVNLINMNGGIGVFTKSENKLCSWITINEFGAIAVLQTLNEYKGKGYASLLIKTIAKRSAYDGVDSITYIVRKNLISQSLFKSLGFRLNNNIRWVQFKNTCHKNLKAHL